MLQEMKTEFFKRKAATILAKKKKKKTCGYGIERLPLKALQFCFQMMALLVGFVSLLLCGVVLQRVSSGHQRIYEALH